MTWAELFLLKEGQAVINSITHERGTVDDKFIKLSTQWVDLKSGKRVHWGDDPPDGLQYWEVELPDLKL